MVGRAAEREAGDGGAGGRPSMRDVALAAGVSVSTVSRALAGAAGISAQSRRRIAEIADALGYDRRPAAGTGERAVLMTVPLELFSVDAAGFYREIMEAVEDELDALGVPLETLFLDGREADGERIAECCAAAPSVGVLCVGVDHPDVLATAQRCGAAVLLVNGIDPEMRLDGVTPANRRGAMVATRHLLDHGHRRIAHVTALGRQTIRERLEGYRAALAAAGVAFDPSLVVDLPALQPEAAAIGTRAALAEGRLDGVTAVFCGSDMVATGVIRALAEAGLAVPDDVSVVGFDNTRITARTRPGLTTVAVDMREIGRQSVRRLVDRLAAPDLTPIEIRIGCRLIERQSVRDLKDPL